MNYIISNAGSIYSETSTYINSIFYYYIKNSTWYHSYTHDIYICIVHKNCIILHFYTYVILKKSVQNFCFLKLFCSLVEKENTKRPGFYTLLVTRVFSNFPQLKQLNKIRNTCEYCDLLELGSAWIGDTIRDSYKKLYCDYVSFRFLLLCFRVL